MLSPVLFLISMTLVAPAFSTSFFEAPFSESLAESPIFVRGIVGGSEVGSVALPDGSQAPFTYWDLKVTEVIKGQVKGSKIRFRQLGGEKDGIGMAISGGAEFSRGEEVVVMLDEPSPEAGDSAYQLRGLSTGKYVVRKDASGVEYLVGSGIQQDSHHADGKDTLLTLAQVRKMAAAPRKNPAPPVSTGTPAKLLGERQVRPAPSPVQSPQDLTPPPPSRFNLSRLWILVVGVALGSWWYRSRHGR